MKIFTVYKKEILETLRDRRTLFLIVVMPIILYPALFSIMSQIMSLNTTNFEKEKSKIAIMPTIPAYLDSLIHNDPKLDVVFSTNQFADLKSRKIQAYIQLLHYESKKLVNVCFDATVERSQLAKERLEEVVQKYKRQIKENFFLNSEMDLALPNFISTSSMDLSSAESIGDMAFSSIVPLLLIVTLIFGAMYPAIDLTAGEKERGTLETILTVPIKRIELLFGKYLTVTTIALITGMLNLLSMLMIYALGFIQIGALTGKFEFNFSPLALLIIFVLLIPLSLFISSAILSVCLFAKSFKEAQNLLTPLYLILIIPALFSMASRVEITGFLSLIPILNISLLFKQILLNNYPLDLIFSVFLSNTIYALIGMAMVSKLFNAEEVLFEEGSGWQFSLKRSKIRPAENFQPSGVLIIFSLIMFLIFYVGSTIQLQFKHWGILATQWLLIFLPIVILTWYNKVDFKKSLHLKSFRTTALLGTIILSLGTLGITTWIAQLQIKVFPEAAKIGEILEKILNFESLNLHPLMGLFIFAISPAICEELLFRGIMLSSLKKKLPPWAAILIVALLFGLFHIQIFRILPTTIIGLYLTLIVYRTGSIYLGMIGHALNNGIALIMVTYPSLKGIVGGLAGEQQFSPMAFMGMIFLVVSGIFLIFQSSPQKD